MIRISVPNGLDRVRLTAGDWVGIVLYTFGLFLGAATAWYGLKSDVREVQQEQAYMKVRDAEQDQRARERRTELLAALQEINTKLDRMHGASR